jgi:hypothetical protein
MLHCGGRGELVLGGSPFGYGGSAVVEVLAVEGRWVIRGGHGGCSVLLAGLGSAAPRGGLGQTIRVHLEQLACESRVLAESVDENPVGVGRAVTEHRKCGEPVSCLARIQSACVLGELGCPGRAQPRG